MLALTDSDQTIQNTYQYDPFGNVLSSSENIPNHYQFIGQWGVRKVHVSSTLFYMRARFYNSQHGRFLTLDPYGISGKSTNLYCYANNNPLENIDPKGTVPVLLIIGIGVGIGAGIGAIANTALYHIFTPEPLRTRGGYAGAFVTGAITGGTALFGFPVAVVGGVVGGALGYLTRVAIDDEDFKWGQFLQESLVEGATAYFPAKPLVYATKAGKCNLFHLFFCNHLTFCCSKGCYFCVYYFT